MLRNRVLMKTGRRRCFVYTLKPCSHASSLPTFETIVVLDGFSPLHNGLSLSVALSFYLTFIYSFIQHVLYLLGT